MGREERDCVPLGHFGPQIQEQSQSGRRHGDRLGLPARALKLSAADLLQFRREKEGAMNAVKAKWENGQVILEGHADWPEGARLFAVLRKAGRTVGAMDLQIAAIALDLGQCTVVTSDSDLSAVPGLSVENWES